jgi:hypothetical protein
MRGGAPMRMKITGSLQRDWGRGSSRFVDSRAPNPGLWAAFATPDTDTDTDTDGDPDR